MKKLILLLFIFTACSVQKPCSINYGSVISGSNTQTVCINSAITPIIYVITGLTGAGVTGLPTGISGTYKTDTFTISGSPTTSGTFPFTVTTQGPCTPVSATGRIIVDPLPTIQIIKTQ